MIGSDAQAMGRIGEVVMRTWQTAHVMKRRRGALDGDGAADNNRVRRYVAKYTICPAVAHGLDHEIGAQAHEAQQRQDFQLGLFAAVVADDDDGVGRGLGGEGVEAVVVDAGGAALGHQWCRRPPWATGRCCCR